MQIEADFIYIAPDSHKGLKFWTGGAHSIGTHCIGVSSIIHMTIMPLNNPQTTLLLVTA